jgi:predicted  nucleic acid-binding Zn-ribbon protein
MRTPLCIFLSAIIHSCLCTENPSPPANPQDSYAEPSAASMPEAQAPVETPSQPQNPQTGHGGADNKEKEELPTDRLHPALTSEDECHYIGEWGDCDPFRMIRIKEERLVYGPTHCQSRKNSTRHCTRDDLPPGTMWLIEQHKICIQELQKLKSMIEDLHRYVDQIHQRGQALFNAYHDLKKRLEDIKRELTNLGQSNHDKEQTIIRLREELKVWREKSQKIQLEIAKVTGEIREKEMKVKSLKADLETLGKNKDEAKSDQDRKRSELKDLAAVNRDLQNSLIDYERYKEEFDDLTDLVKQLKGKIQKSNDEIFATRQEIRKTQLELAKPDPKARYKYNKDTKVNLDMDMWIIHNITKEENPYYYPELKYGQDPANYPPPPSYEKPKYEKPKYEKPKYEEPKYEEPKYEEPKYEEPKYEEPKYEERKYEEPKYEEPQYEQPQNEEPKYEEPQYEQPPNEEPKYEQPQYEEPKNEEQPSQPYELEQPY